MAFPGPLPAKSLLDRHRQLAPIAAVRVSPLCLGAMNFGEASKERLGECSKDNSFEYLDYFVSQGGNFIDTANGYQNEQSEIWLGEWMASRKNRDEIVLATKYTAGFKGHEKGMIQSNYAGNGSKSLRISLEASLKKLQTTYVDILYGKPYTEHDMSVSKGLEKVAKAKGTEIASVALVYIQHKAPYVFPIVGGRTLEHIKANIAALGVSLSEAEVEEIDQAYIFDPGFPHTFLSGSSLTGGEPRGANGPADVYLTNLSANFDWVAMPKPIGSGN